MQIQARIPDSTFKYGDPSGRTINTDSGFPRNDSSDDYQADFNVS